MSEEAPVDYFENLIRTAGMGIIGTDAQLRVQFCNPAAADLLGRSAEELVGGDVRAIVPPERSELAGRLLERILQNGEPVEFELRYPRPDGKLLHLAVSISGIHQDGRVTGLSVFFRDLSRQLELLRDMAQAQKMAALESMAGGVAHHFNNILGGAITTADFALASDDPDLHKRTLGITITALSRANEVTHGLLSFAEGEHSETVTMDIHQTIERYIAGLEPMLRARNIRLESSIQPTSLALPPKGLTIVLDRLITNAVEAMAGGGTLTLQLEPAEAGHTVLRIADSGPGISQQVLPRIFEPFFTTKQAERGRTGSHTGLGLAVVHGIVKDLGGSISVTSAPQTGTMFTIRLPAIHLQNGSQTTGTA